MQELNSENPELHEDMGEMNKIDFENPYAAMVDALLDLRNQR